MGPATAHLYRLYDGSEVGDDGYPPIWHHVLKHEVRASAGHRCLRCLHPYPPAPRRRAELVEVVERGEWSGCDDRCVHAGEIRIATPAGPEWIETVADALSLQSYRDDGYAVAAHWRILTVHHLDGNKANCRWWNLAALCQRCHLTIQGKVVMERRFLREHSSWFQPYAAAYYAFAYLGEDLSLAETLFRLPELLDLEHRQEALL